MQKMKRYFPLMVLWLVLSLALVSAQAADPRPPVAKIIPKIDSSFGDIRTDNYFWLRQKDNPEVISYINAENAYTDSIMKPTEALQKTLFDEMLARIKETDLALPDKQDDYYYYTRTEKGKPYVIHCRKKGSLDAPEEVILDVNELAKGHDFMSVGTVDVSPDHQLLLFSTDTIGSEMFSLHIKNLSTGQIYPEVVPDCGYETSWGNDNKTFFYTTRDDATRPFKLWRHSLGTDPKNDVLVHHEKDSSFSISISRSRSKAFLIMTLTSMITSEVRYLDANNPTGEFKVIQPRQNGTEYYVQHRGDKFYIMTNDNAINFKLVEAPAADPGKQNWKDIIPGSDSVYLTGFDVFANWLTVYERRNALEQILVTDLKTNETHFIPFDEPVYTVGADANSEFNTDSLRISYMSLITPRSIYDYNMIKRSKTLKKQTEVLGGYDPNQYQEERLFAKASDGTMVPISLVYKKGLIKNGSNPLWLYAYGAYGISEDPYFSSNRLSLLNRGFVYAIAHVRGGSEMGRNWYLNGKLLHKKNTFTDFIACAEKLVADKYTSPEKLVGSGGSAGGLLIGAVSNMRPDLFKVIVAQVPFVDIINTMLDPSLPLTVEEFEEWGNPSKPDYYKYMRSYSPYDNVEAKAYPNMLLEGGLNDIRVSYWEPTKWTAKLRAMKTDTNRLLLKIEMAGHGGLSGRYGRLKEIALEYAFAFDRLGIK
jgi:oligopeptidase B